MLFLRCYRGRNAQEARRALSIQQANTASKSQRGTSQPPAGTFGRGQSFQNSAGFSAKHGLGVLQTIHRPGHPSLLSLFNLEHLPAEVNPAAGSCHPPQEPCPLLPFLVPAPRREAGQSTRRAHELAFFVLSPHTDAGVSQKGAGSRTMLKQPELYVLVLSTSERPPGVPQILPPLPLLQPTPYNQTHHDTTPHSTLFLKKEY